MGRNEVVAAVRSLDGTPGNEVLSLMHRPYYFVLLRPLRDGGYEVEAGSSHPESLSSDPDSGSTVLGPGVCWRGSRLHCNDFDTAVDCYIEARDAVVNRKKWRPAGAVPIGND